MVKVRGKKVDLTPSEYVLKDLSGPKGGRGKKGEGRKKRAARLRQEAEAVADAKIAENQVVLPTSRVSDEPSTPLTKVLQI